MSDAIMNAPIAPTPTPEPTSTPTPESWVTQITDPEILGHIQNLGWHNLEPAQAAAEAVKAHRNVVKLMGAPADQLLRIPRPDDPDATKAFWQRLGATDKAEDFKFEGVEFDDPEWQSGFTEAVKQAAIDNHIPREMAEKLAQRIFKFAADKGAERETATAAQMEADRQELVREWGDPNSARFRAASHIADRAIDALGITPEQQQQLADTMGRMAVAKLFHKIGAAMQEDKFVAGNAPAASGIMTREQAVARRSELIADTDFRARFDRGEPNARKELDSLIRIISGV